MHFEQGYFELQDMETYPKSSCEYLTCMQSAAPKRTKSNRHTQVCKIIFPFEHTHQTSDVDNHVGYSFAICYHSYRCATLNT